MMLAGVGHPRQIAGIVMHKITRLAPQALGTGPTERRCARC
jgi:hypothetical protein